MAKNKEFFFTEGAKTIFKSIKELEYKGLSRNTVFTDFLDVCVCCLAHGDMEERYLKVVNRYDKEVFSKYFPQMFAELVMAMEKENKDILGDLFQGAITYGENGQFFTPEHLCNLMAEISGPRPTDRRLRILDPACGSGRLLLSTAKINPYCEFTGYDIDHRCVMMTVINLALNGLRGYAVWGNSLSLEEWMIYKIGFNGKNFIKYLTVESDEGQKVAETVKKEVEQQKEIKQSNLSEFFKIS